MLFSEYFNKLHDILLCLITKFNTFLTTIFHKLRIFSILEAKDIITKEDKEPGTIKSLQITDIYGSFLEMTNHFLQDTKGTLVLRTLEEYKSKVQNRECIEYVTGQTNQPGWVDFLSVSDAVLLGYPTIGKGFNEENNESWFKTVGEIKSKVLAELDSLKETNSDFEVIYNNLKKSKSAETILNLERIYFDFF